MDTTVIIFSSEKMITRTYNYWETGWRKCNLPPIFDQNVPKLLPCGGLNYRHFTAREEGRGRLIFLRYAPDWQMTLQDTMYLKT